jgi:hypothetical protein
MEWTMNHRKYMRKPLFPIHVAEIKAVDRSLVLADHGTILNASATGLLIRVNRSDLNPKILQQNQPLNILAGEQVMLRIVEMDLEIGGRIARTQQAEEELFDIALDLTDNAPAYWRKCLVDLLPSSDEIAPVDTSWVSDLQAIKVVRPLI